ncbi:MAG: hypothetical protein ACP5M0_14245, partial [Desulfomonilaceae bacterium]
APAGRHTIAQGNALGNGNGSHLARASLLRTPTTRVATGDENTVAFSGKMTKVLLSVGRSGFQKNLRI